MQAKDFLRQYRTAELRIENKLAERQRWLDLALSMSPSGGGERVRSSPAPFVMADAVDRSVDAVAEVDRAISELSAVQQLVVETIEQLPGLEYDILHKLYLQGSSVTDFARLHRRCYSWAKVLHKSALDHLQEILDQA